jgi:hypothetical protein
MPGFSVSGPKPRPAAGVTPKVVKYSGETRCPEIRSARAPLSPLNATANGTGPITAAAAATVWRASR